MRRVARRSRITLLCENKNATTHTALTVWLMMVATAAPLTPMPNTKMNSGSSKRFSTAPMATLSMAVVLRPWALIKVFSPSASCTLTVPHR